MLKVIASCVGKKIDGHDHLDLFCGGKRAADAPDTYHYYYRKNELQAVRKGGWKLFFPHGYRTMQGQELGQDGKPGRYTQHKIGEELFNLSTDPHETKDVAKQYPKVVEQLQAIAETARADLGDSPDEAKGKWGKATRAAIKAKWFKGQPIKICRETEGNTRSTGVADTNTLRTSPKYSFYHRR